MILIASAYATGVHRYFSLNALATNRDVLRQLVDANLVLAVLLFMAAYVTIVALSIPGAAAMSIAGGFLFGWLVSVPVTIVAALIGATIVFQIVKTSIGCAVAEKAGPLVQKLSKGFADNAFNFLLFLRLVPVFPFFMVNAVAGLCRVPLRTFIAASAIGIIPGSLVFAFLGAGLDKVIDAQKAMYDACIVANGVANCRFSLKPSALVSPELLAGFIGLGVIALLPVVFKYLKSCRA